MKSPTGSNVTCAPWASLFMWIAMVVWAAEAGQRRPERPLASTPPPAAMIRRRDSIGLLRDQGLFGLGDVPEHNMVVRLLNARMTGVVVEADMVHTCRRARAGRGSLSAH